MLNTDLHNPNIKPERKMTLSQFVGTNKDYGSEVSEGKVLPLDYLVSIYNSIKSSEFETHKKSAAEISGKKEEGGAQSTKTNDNMFNMEDTTSMDSSSIISDDSWEDMLRRSQGSDTTYYGGGNVSMATATSKGGCSSMEVYECSYDIFLSMHSIVSSSLTVVLTTVEDGSIMEEMLDGFLLLARGGAHYNCLEVLDGVMVSLSNFTQLPKSGVACTLTSPQRTSSLLQFGKSHKGHMATMALFGIHKRFRNHVGVHGWQVIVSTLSSLWQLSLLPTSMLTPLPMRLSLSNATVGKSNATAHAHFLTVSRVTRAQAKRYVQNQISQLCSLY